jgi:hypothetical protein
MTDIDIPILPIVAALVLILSAVLMPIVPTGGPSADTSGTVQTPDPVTSEPTDTDADAPTPANAELYGVPDSHTQTATSGLEEPEVHSSTGSQTMSVRATSAGDEPAIVLEDTDTHDGRWVSISTEWFRSEVGSVPAYVTIEHSSGETYNAQTYARSGGTAFYVEEFSTNTVTFSGTTSISASPATDGSTLQYELSSTDSVSNPTVNLTGKVNSENDTSSFTDIGDGESVSLSVAGNLPATNSEITISGSGREGGSGVWNNQPGNNVNTVAADNSTGEVYIGTLDDEVIAYDLDGTHQWTVTAGSPLSLAVNPSSGQIYVASYSDVVALDPDGTTAWTYTSHSNTVRDVVVDPSTGVVYSASDDNEVHAINADGTQKWTYTGHSTGVKGVGVNANAGVVYSSSGGNEVHAINADGTQKWSYSSHSTTVNDVTANPDSGVIYSASSGGEVHAINADGTQKWTFTGHSDSVEGISVDRITGKVYSGSDDGTLRAIRANGTELWSYSTGNKLKDTAVDESNSRAYFGTAGGSGNKVQSVEAYISPPSDPAIDIDSDGSDEISYSGELDGPHTETVDIGLTDESWSISAKYNSINISATIRERTQTDDPTIQLNSQTVSHSGTLADGETVSKSFDNATLQEGVNTINVSVGDGSLSSDAPAPVVDLNYTHDSSDDIATDYTAGKWVESYNVSKTYADDGTNATLTIPFESDVYAIESVETQSNGSTWSETSNYNLNDTTLTVQLGDVDSGEEVAVRTTGYRVQPVNASITVADPTTSGDLDSRIRVDSWESTEDSYLSLGGTPDGERLHYVHDASYSEDHEFEVTSDGKHRLYLPNVGTDDEFNVSTTPYRINAETGEVRYRINDTSEDRFTLEVGPGAETGDTVEYTYLNATSGTNYVLYSETADTVRDQGEASSPVTLVDDDSIETLAIFVDDGGGSSGGSGDGGAGVISAPTSGDPNFIPLAGVALALGLLVIVSRDNETVTDAGSGAADAIGGTLDRVPVVGPAASGAVAGGVQSGAQLVAALFENRIIALLLGGAVVVGAIQGGIIALGPQTQVLVAIAGVGIGSLVALQELGEFTPRRWVAILAAATIVSLQVLGTGDIITAVVDSQVFPLVALGAVGAALWLIQGIRQGLSTPDQVTEIVVDGDRRDGD